MTCQEIVRSFWTSLALSTLTHLLAQITIQGLLSDGKYFIAQANCLLVHQLGRVIDSNQVTHLCFGLVNALNRYH